MTVTDLVRQQAISFQVGHTVIASDSYSIDALRDAVARSNGNVRLERLADDINAEMIDPARVEAFVNGLARLSASSLALLRGRTVRLNLPDLRLHTWSPVSAATLQKGFALAPSSNEANPHLANVRVVAVNDLASAKARMHRASKFCRDNNPNAAAQRRAAAMVWLALAGILHSAKPDDPAIKTEVEAARAALATMHVAPMTGMPN